MEVCARTCFYCKFMRHTWYHVIGYGCQPVPRSKENTIWPSRVRNVYFASIGASVYDADAKGVSCYIALFTYIDVDAPCIREGKRRLSICTATSKITGLSCNRLYASARFVL